MIEDFEGFEVDANSTAFTLKYRNVTITGTQHFPRGALQGKGMGRSLDDAQDLNSIAWETRALSLMNSRTVGMRVRIAEPDSTGQLVAFNRYGTTQLYVAVVADDDLSGDWYLEVYRGSTSIGRTRTLTRDVDVYVEVGATLHPTAGYLQIRFGGQVELTLDGVNTASSGGAGCDSISHRIDVNGGLGGADSIWVVDDIYYASDINFHGDVVVEGVLAEGAGQLSQFTPSAGANWQAIDESSAHDGDTSYVRAAAGFTGSDLYDFQAPRYGLGDPLAGKVSIVARLEAAGVAHVYPLFGDGETSARAGVEMTVSTTSYAYYSSVMLEDPLTSLGWRLGDVLDGEVGIERA